MTPPDGPDAGVVTLQSTVSMPNWAERNEMLLHIARCQLFFIGGAPRSGTTWLQYLLDSHPEISCGGEGLFQKHFAEPLDALAARRTEALKAKNATVFRHGGGYPLPEPVDVDVLLGTAILLALARQAAGKTCRAVGEKTPENVFFFPRLKGLFPRAKFIGIARDPRDVLTSAWHFFHKPVPGEDKNAVLLGFVRSALESLNNGGRAMLALRNKYPSDCLIVTYEDMLETPTTTATTLFRFLGVADDRAIVANCIANTSFETMTGGRPAGDAMNGSFFRKGVVGDWRLTLTPEMNEVILSELGWMYPEFGWTP